MRFIGTANFVGYLLAVLLTPALLSRLRPRPTITAALLLIALGMFGISRSRNFAAIVFLYTLVVIGLIALVTAACAALLLRSHPSDLGLEAVGRPQSGPRFTKPTGPQPGNECPPTIP
jgi:fucose permease